MELLPIDPGLDANTMLLFVDIVFHVGGFHYFWHWHKETTSLGGFT